MFSIEKLVILGLLGHITTQILILPYSDEAEDNVLETNLKTSHSNVTNNTQIKNLLTDSKRKLLNRDLVSTTSFNKSRVLTNNVYSVAPASTVAFTVRKLKKKLNSTFLEHNKENATNKTSKKLVNISFSNKSKATNLLSNLHKLNKDNVRFVQERGVKKNFLENAVNNQPLIEEISSSENHRGILTDDIIKQKVAMAKNILNLKYLKHKLQPTSAMMQLRNLDSMSFPFKTEAESGTTNDSNEKKETIDANIHNKTTNSDLGKSVPRSEQVYASQVSSTLMPPLNTTPSQVETQVPNTTPQQEPVNFISQDYGNVLVSSPKNITEITPKVEDEINDPFVPLADILQKDVLTTWVYKDYIKSPADLMLDQGLINRAKISLSTGKRLRQVFEKALSGKEIHVALITSAVTRAFASDPASQKWLYPNALIDWWQKTITPSTNSSMIYKDVSLTGVGRDYFSRCLKNHLPDNGDTNLVLWELSGSDYKPHGKIKPLDAISLERLLRNTLEFRSHPDLIILNFFRGNNLNHSAYCKELDEESEARLANHYDCTALSWSKSICPYLTDDEEGFSFSYLFSRDKIHPSIIGHAQMAYILIDYIRDEFLNFLRDPKPVSRSFPLPPAIFTQVFHPLCFTTLKTINAVINGDSNDLPVIFISPDSRDEAIHRSKISSFSNAIVPIIMRFQVLDDKLEDRIIGILASFSKPLKTVARLDDKPFVSLQVKEYASGEIMEIGPAMRLSKGPHMLRIWSQDKTFKILAVTLDSIHKPACSNGSTIMNNIGC
ncbi:uncharacterized protein LOC105845842 [Hydra vulgaris]|uniref:uncharacterized protein LOC105845842 n=1 Tax=Hydra vulgaris TaxID=6087 RepID=UPI001F5FAD49|nr:uncharacterized protein LOC105845842 [Hydra vulgaris]